MYQLIRPIAERQQGLTEICGSSKADSGYYPYNPTKHDCCGDMLIGPGETCCNDERFQTPGTGVGEGQCCDGDGFNPNTHTCCGGNIHSISDGKWNVWSKMFKLGLSQCSHWINISGTCTMMPGNIPRG